MTVSEIMGQVDAVYNKEEQRLAGTAKELGAIHGSVMPRTYVGPLYGQGTFRGHPVPRIFVMSINQSRQGQDVSDEEVRQSMRNIRRDENERFKPDGFGPRALAANLTRWLLMQCGIERDEISPEDVHGLMAYDNYVKWPFDRANSEPPDTAWTIFDAVNSKIIEILEPDIILSLGQPMYDRIYEALKSASQYDWEKIVTGWCYTICARWGRCGVGWCYHYSNPVGPNRFWKALREKGKLPRKALRLWKGTDPNAEEIVRAMQKIDEDQDRHPWWGEEIYAGSSFTRYNPYQKWVAWQVCRRLAEAWHRRRQGAS